MSTKLKISEFSRLSSTTVKTLRYYDEINLFVPAFVDPETNYRSYDVAQLQRIKRIVLLKQMGFSLSDIGKILDDELTTTQLVQLVTLKRFDLKEQLEQQQQRLIDLDYWLAKLKQENTMSDYTVTIKDVTSQSIAFVREQVPTVDDLSNHLGRMFAQVHEYVEAHDAIEGTCVAVYYDEEWTGKDIDVAHMQILSKSIPAGESVQVGELPAITAAFTTHYGPYHQFPNAYDAVLTWIYENGYRVNGPAREVYLSGAAEGDQMDCVTEIQFPIVKA